MDSREALLVRIAALTAARVRLQQLGGSLDEIRALQEQIADLQAQVDALDAGEPIGLLSDDERRNMEAAVGRLEAAVARSNTTAEILNGVADFAAA
jgi:hypothetical protein